LYICRAVSEFDSIRFGVRQKSHRISIDQHDVLQIDGDNRTILRCEQISKDIQVVRADPTTDAEDHTIIVSDEALDSAGHSGGALFVLRSKPGASRAP